MSRRALSGFGSFGRVPSIAMAVMILVAACGDDDGGTPKPERDAGGSGSGGEAGDDGIAGRPTGNAGTSGSSGNGTAAGTGGIGTGNGTIKEGFQCMQTAECAAGLACTRMGIAGQLVQICARPCQTNAECMSGESCESPFTRMAADAHCLNFVAEQFASCGIGDTSACGGNRICVYGEFTVGVCVNFCTTDDSVDAGIPGVGPTCPTAGQTCIEGLLSDEELGICGMEAQRGGECGLEGLGKLCAPGDLCVPEDLNDDMSPARCREDCSDSGTCSGGATCTAVNAQISYCRM